MTREQAKREIDSLDYYLQNHTDDYSEESHTAMMMAISALEKNESAEEWYKLILEKWDSAEGEYIKKEDAINCFLKWRPYMATRMDKYEKEMSELPTYSFPDREKETPKLFIDNAVSKNCKNLSESYGEICVKCNKCGRFDKHIGKAESEGE